MRWSAQVLLVTIPIEIMAIPDLEMERPIGLISVEGELMTLHVHIIIIIMLHALYAFMHTHTNLHTHHVHSHRG